jgi:hypothetical protein
MERTEGSNFRFDLLEKDSSITFLSQMQPNLRADRPSALNQDLILEVWEKWKSLSTEKKNEIRSSIASQKDYTQFSKSTAVHGSYLYLDQVRDQMASLHRDKTMKEIRKLIHQSYSSLSKNVKEIYKRVAQEISETKSEFILIPDKIEKKRKSVRVYFDYNQPVFVSSSTFQSISQQKISSTSFLSFLLDVAPKIQEENPSLDPVSIVKTAYLKFQSQLDIMIQNLSMSNVQTDFKRYLQPHPVPPEIVASEKAFDTTPLNNSFIFFEFI